VSDWLRVETRMARMLSRKASQKLLLLIVFTTVLDALS
jgi:hypothetical protein